MKTRKKWVVSFLLCAFLTFFHVASWANLGEQVGAVKLRAAFAFCATLYCLYKVVFPGNSDDEEKHEE